MIARSCQLFFVASWILICLALVVSAASLMSLANGFPSEDNTVVGSPNPVMIAVSLLVVGLLAVRFRLGRVR